MLTAYAVIGVAAGLGAALLGWCLGWPIWAVLGLYMVGGVTGAAAVAGVTQMRNVLRQLSARM